MTIYGFKEKLAYILNSLKILSAIFEGKRGLNCDAISASLTPTQKLPTGEIFNLTFC